MTGQIDLLPLPEGLHWSLEKDMQRYATAVATPYAEQVAELRSEVERLQRQLRQAHKDYGCELRDPNGTIWEYAAAQKARAERLAGVDLVRFREPVISWGQALDYDRHGRPAVLESRKPVVAELLAIIDAAQQENPDDK